jgi:uncharacterized protein (TIGR03437 family)
MNKRSRFLVRHLCLALLLCVLSGNSLAQPTLEQRLQDLNFTVEAIQTRHPEPYRKISASQFLAARDRLVQQAPNLPPFVFYARLSALVALLEDGHSVLSLTNTSALNLGFRYLPIQFIWLDDGLFVGATRAEEADEFRSTELLAINDIPISEAINRVKTFISTENSYWPRYLLPFVLRCQQVLEAAELTPVGQAPKLTLRRRNGQLIQKQLEAVSTAVVVSAIGSGGFSTWRNRRPTENYWSEYWSDAKAVYLRYRLCSEQSTRPFDGFVAEARTQLTQNQVESLIIDLRGNTGGNSEFFTRFTNMLAQQMGTLTRNSSFKIYTIIDSGVFSAGLDAAMDMEAPAFANWNTIIGSPTGSRPDFYGDVNPIKLPGSQLDLSLPSKTTNGRAWIPRLEALFPDEPLSVRSTDFFSRHDLPLAHALARATNISRRAATGISLSNGASFRDDQALAPLTLASLFGNFTGAIASGADRVPLPTQLGGVTVSIDGREAPLSFANPFQINFQVPLVESGVRPIQVRVNQQLVAEGSVTITTGSPGIFIANGLEPTQPGAILRQNGNLPTAADPASAGEVLTIYGTGFGVLDQAVSAGAAPANLTRTVRTPEVWFGANKGSIEFSGPSPQFPGVWQWNVRIPENAGLSGAVPVFVSSDNAASNAVSIWVR